VNCDEVRELLAAYALDALSEDERAAVREHLDGCALHPELLELRATIEALAGSVDAIEPPASLRARVLAIATAPAVAPPVASPRRLDQPSIERRRPMFVPWALAAVVAILAIAIGWWTTTREAQAPVLVTRAATAVTGPSQGRMTYSAESRQLVFEVDALEAAPPGKTYQLWIVRGSTPVSLGTFEPTPGGHGAMTVETTLVEGETLALTVEPAGGSPTPTSQPFLAIKI
jgi:anti-sigma-K factor RskA